MVYLTRLTGKHDNNKQLQAASSAPESTALFSSESFTTKSWLTPTRPWASTGKSLSRPHLISAGGHRSRTNHGQLRLETADRAP